MPRGLFQKILGRHSGAPPVAARPMLRIGAIPGLSACCREACVPMQARGSESSLSQRSPSVGMRLQAVFSVISPLLKARFGGYSAVVVAELAVHPGNTG